MPNKGHKDDKILQVYVQHNKVYHEDVGTEGMSTVYKESGSRANCPPDVREPEANDSIWLKHTNRVTALASSSQAYIVSLKLKVLQK